MGLDLIDRVPDELWTEVHDNVKEARIKNILKKECGGQCEELRQWQGS